MNGRTGCGHNLRGKPEGIHNHQIDHWVQNEASEEVNERLFSFLSRTA